MATDPLARAMFEVNKDRQIAILRQAVLDERNRADAASELANLYGGIVAVFLAGSGGTEIGVTHEQVAAAVAANGMLGVRIDNAGVVALWQDRPAEAETTSMDRPRLALVAG